jgi:very-short-patch-repair endonuclease
MSPVHRRLDEWKTKLIDFTRRNNLLYFKVSENVLRIKEPDPDDVFNRLWMDESSWRIWEPPEEEDTEEEGEEVTEDDGEVLRPPLRVNEVRVTTDGRRNLRKTIAAVRRKAKTMYEETGLFILHVTIGTLLWRDQESGEDVTSPLMLLPVELRRETRRGPFEIFPTDEAPVLNPALVIKLVRDFDAILPDIPEDWDNSTPSEYLNQIRDIADPMGWEVRNDCYLSLFSFQKLVIHKDLGSNGEKICEHPVIKAMAGDWRQEVAVGGSVLNLEDYKGGKLDDILPAKDDYLVLDADSSQIAAIRGIKEGKSIVIQGPPGTGKSQTIANILAAMIALGKKVLFVSEKMAALEVVKKRLEKVHLGRFCLELHSHKAKRSEVVNELWRTYNEALRPGSLMTEEEYVRLERRRSELNIYVRELHRENTPPGWSIFEVLGKLAHLNDVPMIRWTPSLGFEFSNENLDVTSDLSARISQVWDLVRNPYFPWRGCNGESYTPSVRDEWAHMLNDALEEVNNLRDLSSSLASQCGLPEPESPAEVAWLIETARLAKNSPGPPRHWLSGSELTAAMEETRLWHTISTEYHGIKTNLSEKFQPAIFDFSTETHENLERAAEELGKLLGNPVGNAIEHRGPLREFLEDTIRGVPIWSNESQKMLNFLGLSLECLTIEHSLRLSRVMAHVNGSDCPPQGWLDRYKWPEITSAIGKLDSAYLNHEKARTGILRDYDESVFSTDIEGFIQRFSGPYHGIFRWFRSSYYHDRAAIRALRHDGKFPPDALGDLKKIRSFMRIRSEVQTLRKQFAEIFGGLDRGPRLTDFVNLRKRLDVATEITADLVDPGEFRAVSDFITAGNPTRDTYETAIAVNKPIQANRILMDAAGSVVPTDNVPGYGIALENLSFENLSAYAETVLKNLTTVLNTISHLSNIRVSPDSDLLSFEDAVSSLNDLRRCREMETQWEKESLRLKEFYGHFFTGFDSSWENILDALLWTDKIRGHFQHRLMPEGFLDVVVNHKLSFESREPCSSSLANLQKCLSDITNRFGEKEGIPARSISIITSWNVLQKVLENFLENVEQLREWVVYRKITGEFTERGLSDLLDALRKAGIPGSLLGQVVRKSILQGWYEARLKESDVLSNFRGETHSSLIEEFKELDRRLCQLGPHRVIRESQSHRPPADYIEPDGEVAILRRQANLQRKHMPVRKLLERIPNLLPRLKPVVMMGPISVSYFLPSTVKFDLVVFDEASQILPENAIGSIYRGRQVVVCGDSKQLPPTDFFRFSDWEDEDDEMPPEDATGGFPSILEDLTAAGLSSSMLRWHYRSRHEDLIKFSNASFYDYKLVTYPSAVSQDPLLGIRLEHVIDGEYDRGRSRTNRREADRVADIIHEHFMVTPEKTLGVVAFSEAQRDAISQAVEVKIDDHPELERFVYAEDRLDGFFMKNLENVQGDERDVMIFSVGYGRDPNGMISMNFGPLNKEGGERRLNVAITRAREKVILVSSILARDIDLEGIRTAGPRFLQAYLDYAERGEEALALPPEISLGDPESPFEEDVAGVLRGLGYNIVHQVGCNRFRIDIGVVAPDNPERFLLGVECDGATYHSAASARDRDRLRQEILENLGWSIHRVWSPDWVMSRKTEIQKLHDAIERGIEKTRKKDDRKNLYDTPPPIVINMTKDWKEENEEHLPPEVVFYEEARIAPHPLLGTEFSDSANQRRLIDFLSRLIVLEGPIHKEVAGKRLMEAYRISRRGSRVDMAINDAIRRGSKSGKFREMRDFLYPVSVSRAEKVRTPRLEAAGTRRKGEHISIDEIQLAMELVMRRAHSIDRERLKARVAHIFGFIRTGNHINDRFEEALSEGVDEGKFSVDGDVVTLSLQDEPV